MGAFSNTTCAPPLRGNALVAPRRPVPLECVLASILPASEVRAHVLWPTFLLLPSSLTSPPPRRVLRLVLVIQPISCPPLV